MWLPPLPETCVNGVGSITNPIRRGGVRSGFGLSDVIVGEVGVLAVIVARMKASDRDGSSPSTRIRRAHIRETRRDTLCALLSTLPTFEVHSAIKEAAQSEGKSPL